MTAGSASLPRLGALSFALVGIARTLTARRAAPLPVLVAILIGIAVMASGFASPLDDALRSLRDALRGHAASGEIHLVEIDARSLAAIDRWPWPRSVHARAVDRLNAAGARTIAFDVDFSARSTAREDARFAAALRRADGRVILPTFRQAATGNSRASIDNLPIPELRAASFLAAVTIVPSADGIVRHAPLAIETAGAPRPSLGAMLGETRSGRLDSFAIDFAIDPATIPRHSFVDLIEGRIDPALLRGKRVLIGATAVEMGDRYAVPRYGVIPGAVIQAMAGETLIGGRVPVSHGGLLPFTFVVAALIVLAMARRGAGVAIVVLAAFALLLVPVATASLWGLDFAVAAALITLASGAAIVVARSALAAYASRSLGNAATGLPNFTALTFDERGTGARIAAVARIDNAAELAAALGPDVIADLCRIVADRLAYASDGATIYQIDEASFGWLTADEAEMGDRFDALAGLFRAPIEAGGRRIDVSPSFGLGDGSSARHAMANAALAAKRAKSDGVRWTRHSISGADEADWHIGMLGELDAAIENGDLFVVYQPKRDLRTGAVASAEALVRWRHPQRGLIAPDDFINAAEAGGRIDALTRFVLDTALADIGVTQLSVAVNISASLLADSRVVAMVRAALDASGVLPSRLTLEVTESAAMHRTDVAVAVLSELKLLGVRISIDDYGTGQSTLSYLKRLPANELKIDKSFVQSMLDSRSDAILVASTINLGLELGLEIVAEGIENAATLEKLEAMGCTYAQGYHVGRPMPFDALCDLSRPPQPVALAA